MIAPGSPSHSPVAPGKKMFFTHIFVAVVVTCREFFQGQSHIDTWAMAKRVVGHDRATKGVPLKRYDPP